MKPIIDASLVKVEAKLAETMKIVANLFPRYHVTNNITVEAPQELIEQARAAEGRSLPAADLSPEPGPPPVRDSTQPSLVLPTRIGIVKAWNFSGLRLQVEFAILNDTDRLIAIRNVMALVDGNEIPDPQASGYVQDQVRFKQFVDVMPDVRLPSRRRRLPVLVPARSGLWLCAELETLEDVGFGASERECSLFVALDDNSTPRARFAAHGDSFWAAVLARMQETATNEKSAAILGLPITPIR